MSTVLVKSSSPAEYLAIERAAEGRSEYFQGQIFAMSGSTRQHDRICVNLTAALHGLLKGGPCENFTGNMRVRVQPTGLYTYPDASIACEKPEFDDAEVDTLLNPSTIFEVLSPSTERRDRGWKFDQYRQIPSLNEYVLLAQDDPRVERYERDSPAAEWRWSVATGLAAELFIASIQKTIPLSDLYAGITFPPEIYPPNLQP